MNNFRKKLRGALLLLPALSLFMMAGCHSEKDPTEISLSEPSMTVDCEMHTKDIMVTSNAEWKVSSDADWCRPSASKGRGNQTVTILIEVNEGDDRSAVLTFETTSGKRMVAAIVVSQQAENKFEQVN